MIQKKRVIAAGKKYFLGVIAVIGVVSALWCQSFVSLAEPDVPGAEVEPDTVLDSQYAIVSGDNVNVRTAPSANEGVVEQLNRDVQVIVSGETQGSDGKKWYYVTFTGTGGTEKSGFIRSDLLSLGEMVPVSEEETPEPQETQPEPEVVEHDDYELHKVLADDGSYVWYVYDYTGGDLNQIPKKYPLQELMKVTKARSEEDAENAKTIVKQRVAISILAVLLVLVIGAAVIMALKLRDVYYGEDEEEEEQEETPMQRRRRTQETEETPIQRRRREGSGESSTQRKRRAEETEDTPIRRKRRTEETEETPIRRRRRMEEDAEEETVRRRPMRDKRESDVPEVEYHEDDAGSAPVKTAQKRKTKNFLLDDDEFEFEFLNMEDKDL